MTVKELKDKLEEFPDEMIVVDGEENEIVYVIDNQSTLILRNFYPGE